jgi:hypothetical protein
VGKFKLNKRSLKYGSNSIILIAIVVAIAVIVNLLVGMGDFKWDLTSDKIYTLGDESKTIIKETKKDVTIYGLFDDGAIPGGSQYKELINLLGQYEKLGIKISYIDPDKDPGTITSLAGKENTKDISKGDFVVKSGNKVKKLSGSDLVGSSTDYGTMYRAEPLITGAIKFVTADVTPIAYFVEGHEEYSLTSNLTQVKASLENNNMEVKSLSLVSSEKIPDDCKLLVFASPKRDLSEAEKIKVNAYLKNNGRAIFLFDPIESGNKFTNFEEVLDAYNVGINYDKVKELDESRHLPGDEYAIVAALESNDINAAFNSKGEYPVFLPDSRSLSILKNSKEWLVTTSLVKTSAKAEGLSILKQGETEAGPFDLAIASEIKGGSKVLVFGNGTFLTDAALQSQYSTYFQYGEYYFMTTIVNWMQDKEDQTTISSKLIQPKTLTASESQVKVMSIILIGVLPLAIMACGLVVWSRRRHL